jgi:hypothetical protein
MVAISEVMKLCGVALELEPCSVVKLMPPRVQAVEAPLVPLDWASALGQVYGPVLSPGQLPVAAVRAGVAGPAAGHRDGQRVDRVGDGLAAAAGHRRLGRGRALAAAEAAGSVAEPAGSVAAAEAAVPGRPGVRRGLRVRRGGGGRVGVAQREVRPEAAADQHDDDPGRDQRPGGRPARAALAAAVGPAAERSDHGAPRGAVPPPFDGQAVGTGLSGRVPARGGRGLRGVRYRHAWRISAPPWGTIVTCLRIRRTTPGRNSDWPPGRSAGVRPRPGNHGA